MESKGQLALNKLKDSIDQNPLLFYHIHPDSCIKIHPKNGSDNAENSLEEIKKSIINQELPGLVLDKNAFNRYNLNSITVCVGEDPNQSYTELINCIDPIDWDETDLNNLKPLEHQ